MRVEPLGFAKIHSCNVIRALPAVPSRKDASEVDMETNKGDTTDSRVGPAGPATGKIFDPWRRSAKHVDCGNAVFNEAPTNLPNELVDDKDAPLL